MIPHNDEEIGSHCTMRLSSCKRALLLIITHKKTHIHLQALCEEAGLAKTGLKADIIARLRDYRVL